jgi:hypothetical protein
MVVKVTENIPANTILCEYSGEVLDCRQSKEVIKSDSVFEFYSQKSSELVIYPDKMGNLAKFISGINNKKGKADKNVNSMMCDID